MLCLSLWKYEIELMNITWTTVVESSLQPNQSVANLLRNYHNNIFVLI